MIFMGAEKLGKGTLAKVVIVPIKREKSWRAVGADTGPVAGKASEGADADAGREESTWQ